MKFGDLWNYLSADEPGNQARPQTLEQLLLLLTRESARKVVHLANYATASVVKVPRYILSLEFISNIFTYIKYYNLDQWLPALD